MKNRIEPQNETEKVKDILQRSTTEFKILNEYGGDNLQTSCAKADAQQKIINCKYILGGRER